KVAVGLGYGALVTWDRGFHGYPKLRDEIEFTKAPLSLHLGCRFRWRGEDFGALPFDDTGYAALNRLLSLQAHDARELEIGLPRGAWPEGGPPERCALLAERLEGLELLAREGFEGCLLASPRRQMEAAEALRRGFIVVGPQILRFRSPEGLELHRLKRAIAAQSTVTRTEPLWDLGDAAVPRELWARRFPGAEPRIAAATEALLERIRDWRIHWGEWVNAGPLGLDGGLDAELRERVRAGVLKRYGSFDAGRESRMEKELELIRRKGFAAYFLLVQDLVQTPGAEQLKAGTCGRGSGAASLVSYALELTNVDPIGTNLMFERFLTMERKDPPDLDIDFAWDERDGAIQSAFERYGRLRTAMVANHAFFKRRSALRDVALAHGRPESELKTMGVQLEKWGRTRGPKGEAPALPEAWTAIEAWASALEGHFRQFSVHPGGLVITPGPLWEHVAFQPAPAKEGVSITQWDKEGVENYGLVKIDLLGNRSLAVIRDAYEVLGDRVPPNIGEHSRGDHDTRELLRQGDSIGVFYVESPATRQLQKRVDKGDFETLVIHSSLIRPAAYHWVDTYVARQRGEPWTPSHPVFTQLLSDSHGVLIYQEDVVQVCTVMAGWPHAEADQLRKLLGRPDCDRKLPAFRARFFEGCAAREVPPHAAEEAWSMIDTFRGYSFCKPHSASYAQVSFESAWIKAHHPAVFFASVISNQGGFYPAGAYLGDARRHRLVVRGPDANASAWKFTAEGGHALRVGLMQVKGARQEEVEALLEERERHGPFADLDELLRRNGLSLPTVESLCAAGAFDLFAPDGDRTRLLWTRLGGVPPGVRPRPTDPFDRAELELQTMDLTLEIHPAALARVRKGGGPQRVADAAQAGRSLRFWALVVAEKTVRTAKGDLMQFVTLEDETGLCECVAFSDTYKRRRRPFTVGEVVAAQGRTVKQDNLVVLELKA
ncbi:MAG TPA: OB-fold nucleic acid binding domain-containing protein, partial [Holophagaceae bacterium]|nr:OB-fold nucleic acid binding domain-containing protein [Holophagaceae bacterium]